MLGEGRGLNVEGGAEASAGAGARHNTPDTPGSPFIAESPLQRRSAAGGVKGTGHKPTVADMIARMRAGH